MKAFFQELFHVGLYKRNQGRVTRQVTAAAIAVTILAGLWQLSQTLVDAGNAWQFGLPGVLAMVGLWATYRAVNVPVFADFLIAVEAEMNKVSWPSRAELYRSSIVVLVTVFVLAFVLFAFDTVWSVVFQFLGVIPEAKT